jgi:hypothetical protein
LLLVVALFAACDRDQAGSPPKREPQPPRRIIEPPTTGAFRMLPPYTIRPDGVGPYKLGDNVTSVQQQLPSGPSNVRFEIPGIVRTGVIRAEADASVIIGGESGSTVTFVAVVGGSEVASFTSSRTSEKSNVHVGSSESDLDRALGPAIDDVDRATDPHLVIPGQMRNARVVVEDDRVAAIAVISDPTAARVIPESSCTRPDVALRSNEMASCLTSSGEVLAIEDTEVLVHNPTSETKIAAIRIPNLEFAAPLRNLADGRDELVAITSSEDNGERKWSLVAYRLEGARFVRVADEVVYELSNAKTRWIGVDLRDVQLYLELTSQPDGIEVGGLLTTHAGAKTRDVAVISPIRVARKTGKSTGGDASASGSGSRVDAGSANP